MNYAISGAGMAQFVGEIRAAADFLAPGAIEVNRYQTEIFDLVRRRFVLGQRINQVPATGQPSRYFEQTAIASANFSDPRNLSPTASQPVRKERYVSLKAIVAQINYGLFDVEVNQQQGQFAYLEAKDLTDTVDAVLKLHDINLWTGSDTDLINPTTTQYYGISGQITSAQPLGSTNTYGTSYIVPSTASLVDTAKTQVAQMVSRQDYEVKPSGIYGNPILMDLFDQEAKAVQLYFNEVEVLPGVIVKALPTQAGVLPLIPDAALTVLPASGSTNVYSEFILSEEFVEYHWLTSPVPRVFQLGLVGGLAGQFVVVKFGAPVVKGPAYAHACLSITR